MANGPIPLVMTAQGPVPTPPSQLRDAVVSQAEALAPPGFAADLPGTLIEDVASTDTGALILIDQERVDLINSLTPYGANAFLANQLGNVYGVPIGVGSNTSVEVQFYDSTPNLPIKPGFIVGDGSYQYIIQDGGIVKQDGTTDPMTALATQQGSWPVLPNTVINLITSAPPDVILNVTNPQAGLPGSSGQLISDYQAQVLQAGLAASMGMTRYLKTLLRNVPGVQARLISARTVTLLNDEPGWEIIVGGGDDSQVANAIFNALFDISTLSGSEMTVTNVTAANPAVVTTLLNHGYTTGEDVTTTGVEGMIGFPNGIAETVEVISEKTFSIPINLSGSTPYTSGGICTPNHRNVNVTIYDYPDQYNIPIVRPPQQTVFVDVVWNTILPNFAGAQAVAQFGNPAIVDYINSVAVGAPINVLQLEVAFQTAIASILNPANLTRLVISISINGIGTPPESGTFEVVGDPESYFYTTSTLVTILQG